MKLEPLFDNFGAASPVGTAHIYFTGEQRAINPAQANSIVGGYSDGSADAQDNRGHYGQARADADRRKLGRQHLREGNTGKISENPQNIGSIPRGGAEDVDRAVRAASKAFASWSRFIPRERGRVLQKIADAVEAQMEELARIVAEETGNAIRTPARPEAKGASDILRYFGGLASELKGETIPLGDHVLSYTRREPIGVVGAVIPGMRRSFSPRSRLRLHFALGNGCPRAACLTLAGEVECRRQAHHHCDRRTQGASRDRPRRGAAPRHAHADARQVGVSRGERFEANPWQA